MMLGKGSGIWERNMEAASDDFGIMTLILLHFISESVIRDDWEQNFIKIRDTA